MSEIPDRGHARGGRVSRRALLRAGARSAAGVTGVVLLGCSTVEERPPATPATPATPVVSPATPESVTTGGVLRDGALGVIAGVDPHNSTYHGASVVRHVYLNLLRGEVLRPDIGLHHELAESHELADEATYVFRLRDNAVIHANDLGISQRTMDAEDVVACFDRIHEPASAANALPFFARWVDSYDAPDERTVRVVTRGPYAWMLAVLGDSLLGAIAPRELIARGRDVMFQTAIGAGPFMTESVSEGRGFGLERNPRFFDPELPYLDGVRRVIFQDIVTNRTAFQDRQIDVWAIPDKAAAEELARQVAGVTHIEHGSVAYNSFWMRVNTPPWDDDRVRRAMNLSMNRQEYIDLIGRGAGLPMGPLSPAFGPYALPPDELEALQPYAPDEARALFEAAGVREVAFVHPTSEAIPVFVEIMTRQLDAVGVRARPQPLDPLTWLGGYFQSAHSASFSLNQSYKTPEQALLWYRSGGPTGGGQYATGHYSDELDEMLDAAASTLEEEDRIELYREAQRAILESDPAFINVFNHQMHTLHYDDIHGLSPGPGHMAEFLYRHAWIDA